MIIYGVYRHGGEYEDSYHEIVKCFTSIDKAEEYVKVLEVTQEHNLACAERCKYCSGADRTCPRYLESYDSEDCQWWDWYYYDNKETFSVEDIELIED